LGFFGPFPPGKRGGKAGKSTKMGKNGRDPDPGDVGLELKSPDEPDPGLAREKWMLGRMGPKGRLVPSVHLFSIKN